ncbi:MAG: MBL fold metallo-hydrolase [Bacteroidota bacterium]
MRIFLLLIMVFSFNCKERNRPNVEITESIKIGVELVVLGTVQDGGAPHIGCTKKCCERLWIEPDERLKVVSLGVIDHDNDKTFIFEATPDFPEQLAHLNRLAGRPMSKMPDGIFITHAHIGHYTGLMFLGREAKGAKDVPVYVMSRMFGFLNAFGPWNQLVDLKNINLIKMDQVIGQKLTDNVEVQPFLVPHRDEYSETVGFIIAGPERKTLFIPDIDKWAKWKNNIVEEIEKVDLAFVDATFYDAREINNRNISEIPHPFVIESMELFEELDDKEKSKIHFIHLNHTNPLLNSESEAYKNVVTRKFEVAEFGAMLAI